MDMISNLSDDLLLKIVSLLPTKDAVSTTLLSKRWKLFWTMVPRLDFDDGFELEPSRYGRFKKYVDRTMLLRKAPVLETLKFDVGPCCSSEDMETWIEIGMLQGCPVLEELVLDKSLNSDALQTFYIETPTLHRLSIVDICEEPNYGQGGLHMSVINVPSLKYLNFVDFFDDLCLCENMPEVVEANVKAVNNSPEKLLESIPSVKRLYLCLSASMLPHCFEFYHLVHLEICAYSRGWWNLLTWMLESSPKLQVLKICSCNERPCTAMAIRGHWRGPSSVPECLMFHLHTFKWKNYNTYDEEKKIVEYILNNARHLKVACISASRYYSKNERSWKLNELVYLPRASNSCQLLLD